MKTKELIDIEDRLGARNYHPLDVVLSRGEGIWVWDVEGIQSDLTLIGKALSGGFYPVSAVLSNEEVLGVLNPGQHGSTFGGNPLACAVARKALQVLIEDNMSKTQLKWVNTFSPNLKRSVLRTLKRFGVKD